jgi:hypothetical protein
MKKNYFFTILHKKVYCQYMTKAELFNMCLEAAQIQAQAAGTLKLEAATQASEVLKLEEATQASEVLKLDKAESIMSQVKPWQKALLGLGIVILLFGLTRENPFGSESLGAFISSGGLDYLKYIE